MLRYVISYYGMFRYITLFGRMLYMSLHLSLALFYYICSNNFIAVVMHQTEALP
jgi:hypothetical protein